MILMSMWGSIFIFLGIVVIIAIAVTFLMRGAIKDIREHNLEKYLTFSDVIPKSAFMRMVRKNIARANEIETFSIVYVAIDRIADLETSLSQKLIISILQQTVEHIRDTFSNETIIGAVQKGEFYLFISSEYDYDEVMELVYRLFEKFSKPFDITNQTNIIVNISIAVAFYPIHGENAYELNKVLVSLMKEIRDAGGSTVRTLQPDSKFSKSEYLDYYHELKRAIDDNQFEFYYQPVVDFKQNKVINLSLYLRWNQPRLGVLEASKFSKILEQSGNIYFVGLHGLEMMCQQHDYLAKMFGNDELLLKLIVSGREFTNKNLVQDFSRILKKNRAKPNYFILDVPAQILLLDSKDPISNRIAQLKKLGFKFATDVYGINIFDLERLIEKIDVITLSRLFLEKYDNNAISVYFNFFEEKLKDTNIMIIGEQVETEGEKLFYKRNNIEIIQGNLISRPLPFGQIEGWMNLFSGKSVLTKQPEPPVVESVVDQVVEAEIAAEESTLKDKVEDASEEPIEEVQESTPETEVTPELTKDMLAAKTVSELKDIARENNISGYSSLKKQELVELIYQKLVSEKEEKQ